MPKLIHCLKKNGNYSYTFSYGICIRKEAGMNCILYTLCDTLGFSIDNSVNPAASNYGTLCTNDFIVVSGSSQTCNNPVLTSRYCGEYLAHDGAVGGTLNSPICG